MGIALDRLALHKSDWMPIVNEAAQKPYFESLVEFLTEELAKGKKIFPEAFDLFTAFSHCSYRNTRVVFIGQDPYPKEGQANGLAFSVPFRTEIPPTLKNILREVRMNVKVNKNSYLNPSLGGWAVQGVLLLNRILTVEEGKPLSHADKGWEQFTESIIDYICLKDHPVIFVLLGKEAQKYENLISNIHHVIKLPHPSPHSAHKGFLFSKVFNKINAILKEEGMGQIDWKSIELAGKYGDA